MSAGSVSTGGAAPLRISPCVIREVHDADSFHVDVPLHHLWPDIEAMSSTVRLAHVNAAELSTPEGAKAAIDVSKWILSRSPVALHVYGRDKYGRLLADIETPADGMLSAFVLTLVGSKPMAVTEMLVR